MNVTHGSLWSICKCVWKTHIRKGYDFAYRSLCCATYSARLFGWDADESTDPQGCLESSAVAKRTHLEVPVYHLPVKVADYRFSAWMQILCDHKNLRKLKRSLDIFQSTLLARTKPIPKRPWQIFAEGIGSSVLQELSPAVACSLLDSADLLERASCWAKSLPQFCVEFFNSGFTSSQFLKFQGAAPWETSGRQSLNFRKIWRFWHSEDGYGKANLN